MSLTKRISRSPKLKTTTLCFVRCVDWREWQWRHGCNQKFWITGLLWGCSRRPTKFRFGIWLWWGFSWPLWWYLFIFSWRNFSPTIQGQPFWSRAPIYMWYACVVVKQSFIVPTPLEGGGTIYSNGFFLFRQFLPIDMFIVESWDWYH